MFNILLFFSLSSCNSTHLSEKAYYRFLNDPKNGLVKVKEANGFKLEMKYFPPEVQAFNELSGSAGKNVKIKYDSLVKQYNSGLAFILSISDPDQKPGTDIVQYGIFTEPEFKKRFNDLHFNIGSHIWIASDSAKVFPVLTMLESTLDIIGPKTFYLTFDKSEVDPRVIDLVFHDTFFDTGINHFVFNKENLNNLPKISF